MDERPTCPDCRVEMDLVSMRADGEGCDWLCWGCWYRERRTAMSKPRVYRELRPVYESHPWRARINGLSWPFRTWAEALAKATPSTETNEEQRG